MMHFSKNSLATSRSRIKGYGSAKSGTGHFWLQRMTAVALIPLTIGFVCTLITLAGADFKTAVATLKHPFTGIVLLAFIGAGLVHMRVGMQVIIEDYVHTEGTKILCLMLNTFFTVVIGLSCVYALLKISFGM